jgi:hypothetical protein
MKIAVIAQKIANKHSQSETFARNYGRINNHNRDSKIVAGTVEEVLLI